MPLYVGTKVAQIMNQFEYQSYSCDTVLCFKKTSKFAEKAYLIKTALRLKYIHSNVCFNIQYIKENISKQASYNSKHIFMKTLPADCYSEQKCKRASLCCF